MDNKNIILEELHRMKNLMGYDLSKTLNENQTIDEENDPYNWKLLDGSIVKGTSLNGKIPLGAKLVAPVVVRSLASSGGAATVSTGVVAGETTASATFLGLGPVGWVVVGTIIGLAALGYWLWTKDSNIGKMKKLFNICKTDPNMELWERYFSQSDIEKKSNILRKSIVGLGTDEQAIYNVFKSFKSPGDFCDVSNHYQKSNKESLFDAIDGDFDYGWQPIAISMSSMVKNFYKKQTKEYCDAHQEECDKRVIEYCKKNPKNDKCKDLVNNDTQVSGNYNSCSGVYHKGCFSKSIEKAQDCLGITVDGKFGDETESAIFSALGKNTFTDSDIDPICG